MNAITIFESSLAQHPVRAPQSDGELECVGNIQLGMGRAGFEIHGAAGLRLGAC